MPYTDVALEHAALVVGPTCAHNLLWRNGPCDICGGDCLCQATNEELMDRLQTGLKPVGTLAFRRKAAATACCKELEARGLAYWMAKNRWKMYVAVAALHPDKVIPGIGKPRDLAFTQQFIDERLPYEVTGALYGYTLPPDHSFEEMWVP